VYLNLDAMAYAAVLARSCTGTSSCDVAVILIVGVPCQMCLTSDWGRRACTHGRGYTRDGWADVWYRWADASVVPRLRPRKWMRVPREENTMVRSMVLETRRCCLMWSKRDGTSQRSTNARRSTSPLYVTGRGAC
jgi:hypothetical protein